jgi:hypothetical protein
MNSVSLVHLGLVQFIYLLTLTGTSLLASGLILHPILIILAVVVVYANRAWRDSTVPVRHSAQLVAYGLSLILITAGRMIVA